MVHCAGGRCQVIARIIAIQVGPSSGGCVVVSWVGICGPWIFIVLVLVVQNETFAEQAGESGRTRARKVVDAVYTGAAIHAPAMGHTRT